ncbi:FeoA family protein [Clostridium oceanicum]|uniref:Ferrous iron transporter FeoA-like domain-containing protein n=1 Tax=Clostridium oceanicum TaxID=1543 RepID=A0ABP3UFR0_9CLOT
MDHIINSNAVINGYDKVDQYQGEEITLSKAEIDKQYIIKEIKTDDEELKDFLFTLGCYEGEEVTVISVLAENYVINVKDARYSIDTELAGAIVV